MGYNCKNYALRWSFGILQRVTNENDDPVHILRAVRSIGTGRRGANAKFPTHYIPVDFQTDDSSDGCELRL